MNDPAVAAAYRAHDAHGDAPVFCDDCCDPAVDTSIAAAREALAPLRARHYPVAYINRQRCCVSCFDWQGKPKVWPCDDARLIYPEEEL